VSRSLTGQAFARILGAMALNLTRQASASLPRVAAAALYYAYGTARAGPG